MDNIEHNCKMCNYTTIKKSSYKNHLNSKKHLKKINDDNNSVSSDMTETTDYCIDSSVPSRKLVPQPLPQPTNTINDFQIQHILQEITLLKSQNLIYQNEISTLKTQLSSLEMKIHILNNNEIQALKACQQINTIVPNIQQIQTVTVPNKKIVYNKQTDNTVVTNVEIKETVTTPVKPTHPTLTEYLNTTCNEAGDFDDFRKNNPDIDINKIVNKSHLTDFPNSEESLTNYVMMILEHTPIEKIPFRCINVKNKTCIIKVKGKWYSASDECRDSFIDYAKARLNSHYMRMVLDVSDKKDKEIATLDEKINRYERLKYLMQGETEEKKMELMEQFEGYESFNLARQKNAVRTMGDQQCDIVGYASKFPDVNKTSMETLQKSVLKYIKIDMKDIEAEDLPMYYPEVVESVTEPVAEPVAQITRARIPEPVEESPVRLFSNFIIEEYRRKCLFQKLNGNLLETLVKQKILSAFGKTFQNTTPIYFETSYSKEELVKKMEFFNTIKEISNVLENDEPTRFKEWPIQKKIEELAVENKDNYGTPPSISV